MPKLYNWHINEHSLGYCLARGIVTGHPKLEDSAYIHTSPIEDFNITDETAGIAVIKTHNNNYEVKLSDLDITKMKEAKDKIGIYAWGVKLLGFIDKYTEQEEIKYNTPNKSILLVLGNNKQYYFDRLIINNGIDQLENKNVTPHIGTVQDSVLCMASGEELNYDIRYFTYKDNNIDFYMWDTNDLDVYIQNTGDNKIRARLGEEVYVVEPGCKLLISKENKSNEKLTSESDLYTNW